MRLSLVGDGGFYQSPERGILRGVNQFISTIAKHTEFAVLTIKITGSKKTREPKFVLDKEVKGFK